MSTGPVTGGRAWLGAGLVVVAVLTGAATLRTLVAPGPWTTTLVGAVVVVAVVTTTARVLGRTRWAPTAWGLVAALAVVAALWSSPLGARFPLPTLGTLRGLRRTFDSGTEAIAHGHIPLTASPGVEMLVVAGALVVLLVADLLALGLRRPGAAGLAVAGLWAVPVVFERTLGVGPLVLGGASFLLLLAVVRPARRAAGTRQQPREVLGGAAAAVAVALVAVLVAPASTALPGWGSVRLPTSWGGSAPTGPVRLSLDLDMRASLGSQTTRTLLTYTADGQASGPLRLYTLTTFDGRQWARDPDADQAGTEDGTGGADAQPLAGVLWPTELGQQGAGEPGGSEQGGGEQGPDEQGSDGQSDVTTMRIQVHDLDTDRLPLPLDPREVVALPGAGWRYDATRDEVLAPGSSVRGLGYEVVVHDRDLSADVLAADRPATVEAGSPLLAVPGTPAADDIRALAEEVTAGAATAHDKAVALQTWFRDARRFRYDTRVPAARSDDAVWDFLNERTGYCVQYATAMTVMARHLGIPARMAVGFLPGRATPSGERVVTGRLAHTWPELWFADSGWVRFEPTPAVQTGSPPVYADPLAVDPISPEEREPSAPTAAPTTPATPPPAAGGSTPGGEVSLGDAQIPRLLVVLVAVLLVTAVLVVRLRRPQLPPEDAEEAWSRLRRRLRRHGLAWSDATTPRAAAAEVLESLHPEARQAAEPPLHALVRALESTRYAPVPARTTREDLASWVAAVDTAVVRSREAEQREDRQVTVTV